MEKNVRNSCTGNSRHISIRFCFVEDCVYKEEFIIKYCNTLAIITDLFTKPLQGSLFWRPREVIMGWVHINILQDYVPPPYKEPVENHVSGDKPDTSQKATYVQIVTGDLIQKENGKEW